MKPNIKERLADLKSSLKWSALQPKIKKSLSHWYRRNIPGWKDIREMFKMGGDHNGPGSAIVQMFGLILLVLVWFGITTIKFNQTTKEVQRDGSTIEKTEKKLLIPSSILPHPMKVWNSYDELLVQDELLLGKPTEKDVPWYLIPNYYISRFAESELAFSLKINISGYLKAIAWSVVLGFLAGLFPIVRNLTGKYLDAIRYIPLTAITGLFVAWYGIYDEMKINFLTFGIFVYLMPTVVQRIDDTQKVYLQTAWTLGANSWQKLRHVYLPSVLSRVFDDIRVITAISWTYIIVAELVNNEGGIGSLIYTQARTSRTEKVFALLFVIIIVGLVQDIIYRILDRMFFPFKYAQSK